MWKKSESTIGTVIIGFLKTAKSRKLYLTNNAQNKPIVKEPICVLDFFVHSDFQKQGYAHVLFNNMLEVIFLIIKIFIKILIIKIR